MDCNKTLANSYIAKISVEYLKSSVQAMQAAYGSISPQLLGYLLNTLSKLGSGIASGYLNWILSQVSNLYGGLLATFIIVLTTIENGRLALAQLQIDNLDKKLQDLDSLLGEVDACIFNIRGLLSRAVNRMEGSGYSATADYITEAKEHVHNALIQTSFLYANLNYTGKFFPNYLVYAGQEVDSAINILGGRALGEIDKYIDEDSEEAFYRVYSDAVQMYLEEIWTNEREFWLAISNGLYVNYKRLAELAPYTPNLAAFDYIDLLGDVASKKKTAGDLFRHILSPRDDWTLLELNSQIDTLISIIKRNPEDFANLQTLTGKFLAPISNVTNGLSDVETSMGDTLAELKDPVGNVQAISRNASLDLKCPMWAVRLSEIKAQLNSIEPSLSSLSEMVEAATAFKKLIDELNDYPDNPAKLLYTMILETSAQLPGAIKSPKNLKNIWALYGNVTILIYISKTWISDLRAILAGYDYNLDEVLGPAIKLIQEITEVYLDAQYFQNLEDILKNLDLGQLGQYTEGIFDFLSTTSLFGGLLGRAADALKECLGDDFPSEKAVNMMPSLGPYDIGDVVSAPNALTIANIDRETKQQSKEFDKIMKYLLGTGTDIASMCKNPERALL